MALQPVILSGGSGTRLWPLSREAYPKQFLPLSGGERTMFQETVERLAGTAAEEPRRTIGLLDPIVVCNESHRFLVAEQLRLLGRRPAAIILEPEERNTAPALDLAALAVTGDGRDPVLLAMPADHVIRDGRGFRQAVADGYVLARQGAVVTFGIVPDGPETGYGYIRRGDPFSAPEIVGAAHVLDAFVEKPDAATVVGYLESGDYLWNSGIFMLRASLWRQLLARFRPDIAAASETAYLGGAPDGDFRRLDVEAFHACPGDSIDYAVMEHLTREGTAEAISTLVLPLDVGWSDVGAWSTLWAVRAQDAAGNVRDGDTFVHDARDNLLMAQHRMVAAVGVSDLILVETPDAVLVASKEAAQDIKTVTRFLQREQRSEYRHHQRIHRPWGNVDSIGYGERYQVKRLTITPGESISLQMHHHRAEHWIVVSGTARVTNGDKVFLLTENESTYIPVGTTHRLENPGAIPLEIIEVQSGGYLGEDDIVRFEDTYNRTTGET
ncbi:MAG: mannose-1-phosphate guanylyltransferase/mannose-6-phosphate isomerase [Candidatus Thiosymbion ectosymbiont of Robbea hypermnestra]|nr:mannose-1-phosphate guanylyltransferase/mannose-6-phosphate isomerase [Candidatus Thiosymbion ectosymbiont of Robbea hypermnestra]